MPFYARETQQTQYLYTCILKRLGLQKPHYTTRQLDEIALHLGRHFKVTPALLSQKPLQNLAARILGNGVDKLDAPRQSLVLGQPALHVLPDRALVQLQTLVAGPSHNKRPWELALGPGESDADNSSVHNLRVRDEDGLELRRRHLKAAHLDELLLPVDNVPLARLAVAVAYVARLVPALRVEAFRVGRVVVKVARGNGRASNADFAADPVVAYFAAVVANKPNSNCQLV